MGGEESDFWGQGGDEFIGILAGGKRNWGSCEGWTASGSRTRRGDQEPGRWIAANRLNGLDATHGQSADGAGKREAGLGGRKGGFLELIAGGGVIRERLVEQEAQGGQAEVVGVSEEAEVAHLDEAFWEDVLEETVDELFGGESAELELAGVGRAIAEGNLVVLELVVFQ
jgi:hypothetical protein